MLYVHAVFVCAQYAKRSWMDGGTQRFLRYLLEFRLLEPRRRDLLIRERGLIVQSHTANDGGTIQKQCIALFVLLRWLSSFSLYLSCRTAPPLFLISIIPPF